MRLLSHRTGKNGDDGLDDICEVFDPALEAP
jgi:hypothetical protein